MATLDTTPHFASEAQEMFTAGDRIYTPDGTTVAGEGTEGAYIGRLDDRRAVVEWDTPSGEPYRETVRFDAIRQLYR